MAHFEPRGALADADLRSASLIDADDVASLLWSWAIPATRATPRSASPPLSTTIARRWWSRAAGGAVCGLVALDFMYYLPLDTVTCRITALVVTPSAQGRGLGRQLLREAERRARAAGAARVELTSGSQRADAHAFYKACGYSDGTLRFIKRLGDA